MLTELIKYKEILADQTHFGPAVTSWLERQISKSDESDQGCSLRGAYWTIGELRRVGPIVPEQRKGNTTTVPYSAVDRLHCCKMQERLGLFKRE
jgi:hypothetical protein